jgi:hypothetical protein
MHLSYGVAFVFSVSPVSWKGTLGDPEPLVMNLQDKA